MAFGRAIAGAREVESPTLLVYPGDAVHHPVTGGQGRDQRAVVGVAVEMLKARPLRRPDEAAQLLQRAEEIVQIDPDIIRLAQDRRPRAGAWVKADEIEDGLHPVLD